MALEIKRDAPAREPVEHVHFPERSRPVEATRVDLTDAGKQRPQVAAVGQRVPIELFGRVDVRHHFEPGPGPGAQPVIERRPHRAAQHARDDEVRGLATPAHGR